MLVWAGSSHFPTRAFRRLPLRTSVDRGGLSPLRRKNDVVAIDPSEEPRAGDPVVLFIKATDGRVVVECVRLTLDIMPGLSFAVDRAPARTSCRSSPFGRSRLGGATRCRRARVGCPRGGDTRPRISSGWQLPEGRGRPLHHRRRTPVPEPHRRQAQRGGWVGYPGFRSPAAVVRPASACLPCASQIEIVGSRKAKFFNENWRARRDSNS